MIVVDASALVAIGQMEPERDAFLGVLDASAKSLLAPLNYVEAAVVLTGRGLFRRRDGFDAWLAGLGVTVFEDADLATGALDAFLLYGKGFHPARLNLGDCFAYALAKSLDAPLLCKGGDFSKTDIRLAI